MRSLSEIAIATLPEHWAVRVAHWGARPGALVWQPEPIRKGSAVAGRRLASGLLLFDGRLIETDARHPWDIEPPDHVWSDLLHGHGWLDDAAATEDPEIWDRLAVWVWEWLDRHEDGTGPGWRPELVARRLVRWIGYTIPLIRGQGSVRSDLLFRAIAAHLRYLASRWGQTRPGGERIEALAGLVYGMISLEGTGDAAGRAIVDLARAAETTIAPDGGIPSRNPEELADIVAQLIWIGEAIRASGLEPAPGHDAALRRAVPVLSTLMGTDGDLPRFHGGRSARGTGLGEILVRAPAPLPAPPNPAMGFLRLAVGDSVVVVDAAAAPRGLAAGRAHSSGPGIEFTHDGQPIVVNTGSGSGFGRVAERVSRLRPAHSSVEVAGTCPAELIPGADVRDDLLLKCPGDVHGETSGDGTSARALCESTEYEEDFGLTIERRLQLDADGPRFSGEDIALATRAETRALFTDCFPDGGQPCPLTVRFHLHPDIRASHAGSGRLIGLILPDGSRWSFRTDAAEVTLAPGDYHDQSRPRPRAALQIVATSYLIDFRGRITWTFQRINDGV